MTLVVVDQSVKSKSAEFDIPAKVKESVACVLGGLTMFAIENVKAAFAAIVPPDGVKMTLTYYPDREQLKVARLVPAAQLKNVGSVI